ncbi:hypothetical protein EPA93_40265 [Ktedonosporobacter rubrisoli]|uniref:Mannanase galactose-binding domain-containing protein n=1 Tax=Ktedonosporobacter rubrisoli TaxID=2509675 RepID=A0A4V0Z039_KTERU|nr:hypothetical protein [Ktedonosporobacter rubrisoli]QBD81881.1 hypothetical protein EPA93_40265 [Ktedonosporobacter rubrisoli]
MIPTPGQPRRKKGLLIPALIAGLIVIVLLAGASAWFLANRNQPGQGNQTPSVTPTGSAPNGNGQAISPFLFGTNLGLYDAQDQVLTSATTRQLLQQLHMRIIRMPSRRSLNDTTVAQAAQVIKNLGATPLVVLHGEEKTPNALAEDTAIVKIMNDVFGHNIVYYEYSNEDDLAGISADRYTTSWNKMVPQLKQLALNGQFIGPVNYHYDGKYLGAFLQNANPRPDAISWHEYACDSSWSASRCITEIGDWNTHIANARSLMQTDLGKELPIMITEWNYAPNANPNDGKLTDSNFMSTWTTKAIQTLAANHIFAAMQYSCTNGAITLISNDDTLTAQGQALEAQYKNIIVDKNQLTPIANAASQATPTAANEPGGPVVFSFEDGGLSGWSGHSQGISNVQNTTSVAKDGSHSLEASLSNTSSKNFPYLSIGSANLSNYPKPGQTITAYVYLSSNSVNLQAKVFIVDGDYKWHSDRMVTLTAGTWNRLSYTVPQSFNGQPSQLGIQFNSTTSNGPGCNVFIDAIGWS